MNFATFVLSPVLDLCTVNLQAEANSKIQAAEDSNSSRTALCSKRPVFNKQIIIGGPNRARSGFPPSSKFKARLPGSAAASSSSASLSAPAPAAKAEEEEEKEENFKPQKDMPKEEDLNNWALARKSSRYGVPRGGNAERGRGGSRGRRAGDHTSRRHFQHDHSRP